MSDDAELLSRYADQGSEDAFAELVRRHVDLVYGAAMRRTGGDSHRAADVSQQVFTHLARNARKLSRHTQLPAWLHTATRNAALNLMIAEQRRQTRETEAVALNAIEAMDDAPPDWEQLRPLLDSAIDELPEVDRAAVVLRYLERRPFAEIAAALRLSEDAARMRTDRALEKLRPALARRGIVSTAAALGAVVFAQPLLSAPAGLAPALASKATAAVGATSLATLMHTKIIVTAVVGALLTFLAGSYVGYQRSLPPAALTAASLSDAAQTIASLRQENLRLKAKAERLNADVAQLNETNAQMQGQLRPKTPPRSPTLGMARWELQRNILNNLRQIMAARDQYHLEYGKPPEKIDALVGRRSYIRAMRTVDGEDYSGLSMAEGVPLTVTTPDGMSVTFDPYGKTTTQPDVPPEVVHMEQLAEKVQPKIRKATAAYKVAHNGASPPNSDAMLAYFATPEEAADFADYLEAQKAANNSGP